MYNFIALASFLQPYVFNVGFLGGLVVSMVAFVIFLVLVPVSETASLTTLQRILGAVLLLLFSLGEAAETAEIFLRMSRGESLGLLMFLVWIASFLVLGFATWIVIRAKKRTASAGMSNMRVQQNAEDLD